MVDANYGENAKKGRAGRKGNEGKKVGVGGLGQER